MTEYKRFLSAQDVASELECSKSKAYTIIKQLNEELTEKGFVTLHGKINAKYFYERTYDGVQP